MSARVRRGHRPGSARGRLAITYAAVVLATGSALLVLLFGLFQLNLAVRPISVSELDCRPEATPAGPAPDELAGGSPAPGYLIECRPGGGFAIDPVDDGGPTSPPVAGIPVEAVLGGAVLDAAVRRLVPLAMTSILLLAVASLGIGWWMAGRALSPVRTITDATRSLSETNLHERIRLTTRDREFVDLATTVNGMLARLERAFEAQRDFVANASHELRTPLAIARAELDVSLADPDATIEDLRRMGRVLHETNTRSERVIDALLTLAQAGQPIRREPVDLAALTQDALAAAASHIERRRLTVDVELEPATVRGDQAMLERLIENVVGNAIVHNVEGGHVSVTSGRVDGSARLVVTNSGRTIPDDEVPRLFDRIPAVRRRGGARARPGPVDRGRDRRRASGPDRRGAADRWWAHDPAPAAGSRPG